eukprot:2195842-Pleurochrysis_carterae.AAC.2
MAAAIPIELVAGRVDRLSHTRASNSAAWSHCARLSPLLPGYLTRLSTMPCKHFAFGAGTCPFGSSCFYAHVDRAGNAVRTVPRRVVGGAGPKVVKTYHLADYLFRQETTDQVLASIPFNPQDEEAFPQLGS